MKLRCYVCGEPLKKDFYLVSYQDDSDRVFVFDPECVKRVDTEAKIQRVRIVA
jgi:hypothetical protein